MATEITSYTPSELLHGYALGILDERGKGSDYTSDEYVEALEEARLVKSDLYAQANPSAARENRRRVERRLETERSRP
jgi:hypothetical protein